MDVSNNEAYAIALGTDGAVLSVDALLGRIPAICAIVLGNGVQSGDKVVVYIPDETLLLPVLWALVRLNVTCIPIRPGTSQVDITNIGLHAQARYMITLGEYVGLSGGMEAIVIDHVMDAPAVAKGRKSAGRTIPYVFYREQDGYLAADPVSYAALDRYFEEMDMLLLPGEGRGASGGEDVLMISRGVNYQGLIMELIWASSRGITVVIDQVDSGASLLRYTRPKDRLSMDFGLFHFGSYIASSEKNKFKQLLDTVKFADNNGFGCVWTPERHFNEFGGLFPNPSVLSAALAVITTKVQIRSGSLVSPLHHPARIAEDWSLVDNLSDGRVAISFASGWQCDDFIFFPENYARRHVCMMEQIDIVKRLWRGEKVNFKNGLEKEIGVAIFPKPVQQELPVWITVSGRTETFIDAGKIGANILTHLLWQDASELIDKIAAYRKSLADNGFDPRSGKVAVMVHTYLGADNEAVRNKVREPLKNYIRTSTQLIQSMVKSDIAAPGVKDVVGRFGGLDNEIPAHLMDELVEIAFNRFFEQAGLLGTIEKATGLIKRLKGYDVDEIAALIDFGLSGEDIMEGLGYLNKLREMYDRKTFSGYGVTIAHYGPGELEDLIGDPQFMDGSRSQRVILVDADHEAALPDELSEKVRLIRFSNNDDRSEHTYISKPAMAESDIAISFNSSISDEF